MADDVTINIRTRGGKQAASDVDHVGTGLNRLNRRARDAGGGMRLFSRATVGATGHLRLAAGAAVTGAAAFGGALVIGLKRSVDAWQESRKVAADTQAVLKSTHGVAHVTAGGIDQLTQSLSRKAGMDDEAIQSGENVLLTFLRVRNEVGKGNDVFNRASAAAVDLSARFGKDLNSSFTMVGKALDDPIRGVTALRRVGVSFTASQQDQIKSLEETGQHLKAQRLVMRALETQVKGSAAAQATPIDRLKVSWENVQEAIGKGVSPAVDAVADKLDRFMLHAEPRIDRLGTRLGDIVRSDATPDMKLQMSRQAIRQQLGPLEDELKADIRRMKLGPAFSDAIDEATPAVLNAMGRNAGRGAVAFLRGWAHADLGGQLLSAGLIAWKFGAFRRAGGTAGSNFYAGFASRFGPLLAAYLLAKLGQKVLGSLPIDIGSDSVNAKAAADTDPSVKRGRSLLSDRNRMAALRAFQGQHPGIDMAMDPRRLAQLGDPALIPGAPGVPKSYRVRDLPGPHGTHVTNVYLDGHRVAHIITTNHGNALAKGVHRAASDAKANRRGG